MNTIRINSRVLVALSLLAWGSVGALGQAPGIRQDWVFRYTGHGPIVVADAACDQVGSTYVCGAEASLTGDTAIILVKITPTGGLDWVQRYEAEPGGDAYPVGIAFDGDKVFVGGTVYAGTVRDYDMVALCYLSDGGRVWAERWNGPYSLFDQAEAACATPDHGFVVAGRADTTTASELTLVKYGPSGTRLWTKRYPWGTTQVVKDIACDSKGNIVGTGAMRDGTDGRRCIAFGVSGAGSSMWLHQYAPAQRGYSSIGNCIDVGKDDAVAVVGQVWTGDTSQWDVLSLKFDPNGSLLASDTFNGNSSGFDLGQNVVLNYDGSSWALVNGTFSQTNHRRAAYMGWAIYGYSTPLIMWPASSSDEDLEFGDSMWSPAGVFIVNREYRDASSWDWVLTYHQPSAASGIFLHSELAQTDVSGDDTPTCMAEAPGGHPIVVGNSWMKDGRSDLIAASFTATSLIQGRVTFSGSTVSPYGKNVLITVVDADSGSVLAQGDRPMLDGGGYFEFSTFSLGRVSIYAKRTPWLTKCLGTFELGPSGLWNLSTTLDNGDIDGDDAVTVFDYNELSQAFDSTPSDPNWLPTADLDEDGMVTVFDYVLLSDSFDKVGDSW